jgi:sortase B
MPIKRRVSGLDVAAGIARKGGRLLDRVIALMLIITLLYGSFGLWDDWMIYRDATVSSDLLQYRPLWQDQGDAANPTLAELQKINPDVCAWLTLDDTNIDYPVVQGKNNMVYLNKAVDKTFSLSGSIFLDYRNQSDFSDAYSIIYGHHMEGGVMFGQLTNFRKEKYFEEHPTGYLFLPDCTYTIQWFACVETDAFDSKLYTTKSEMDEAYGEELLAYIQQTALQYREIGVSPTDKIIALSTCSSASTDGRTLLIGRMEKVTQELEGGD